MPRANTNSRIAYNKGYQRDRKARLRAEGKCLDCGREDALPSVRKPGTRGPRCAACKIRARGESRAFMARRRPAAKALGLCVVCLKNESMKATSHGASKDNRCAACADQQLEYKELRHVAA